MSLEEAQEFERTVVDRRERIQAAYDLINHAQLLIEVGSRLFGPRSGDTTVWDLPRPQPAPERTPGIV